MQMLFPTRSLPWASAPTLLSLHALSLRHRLIIDHFGQSANNNVMKCISMPTVIRFLCIQISVSMQLIAQSWTKTIKGKSDCFSLTPSSNKSMWAWASSVLMRQHHQMVQPWVTAFKDSDFISNCWPSADSCLCASLVCHHNATSK